MNIYILLAVPAGCLVVAIGLIVVALLTPLPDEATERPVSIRISYTDWDLEIPEDMSWTPQPPRR